MTCSEATAFLAFFGWFVGTLLGVAQPLPDCRVVTGTTSAGVVRCIETCLHRLCPPPARYVRHRERLLLLFFLVALTYQQANVNFSASHFARVRPACSWVRAAPTRLPCGSPPACCCARVPLNALFGCCPPCHIPRQRRPTYPPSARFVHPK